VRRTENASALFVGVRAPEVAQQPGAHLLRFPDVQDFTILGDHAIDAGPVGGAGSDDCAHRRELGLGGARSQLRDQD
jgi:hypothetical protein